MGLRGRSTALKRVRPEYIQDGWIKLDGVSTLYRSLVHSCKRSIIEACKLYYIARIGLISDIRLRRLIAKSQNSAAQDLPAQRRSLDIILG